MAEIDGEVCFGTGVSSYDAEEASKGTLAPTALRLLAEILTRSNESGGLPSMTWYPSRYLDPVDFVQRVLVVCTESHLLAFHCICSTPPISRCQEQPLCGFCPIFEKMCFVGSKYVSYS